MKKVFSLILCFALMLTFISCGYTNKTTTVSNEISTSTDRTTPTSKKEYYLNILDDMCKHDYLYNENDTPEEKLKINSIRQKRWIGILKEIYGVLKADLPEKSMDKLEKEEIKWIEHTKEKAEIASLKADNETLREVVYLDNLIDSIKERCYKLVNKYMIN